jgi:hypothetical protein
VIFDVLLVVLRTLGAIVAAAILVFGFAFVIFLGDANARDQSLVSRGFDTLAALVVYLSWFGLLWQFGFSKLLLMVACGATVTLCVIYAASYQTAASRRLRRTPPSSPLSPDG